MRLLFDDLSRFGLFLFCFCKFAAFVGGLLGYFAGGRGVASIPERESGPPLWRGARYFRAGQCLVVPAPLVTPIALVPAPVPAVVLASTVIAVVVVIAVAIMTGGERREHVSYSHSGFPFPSSVGGRTFPDVPLRWSIAAQGPRGF
jgi:hypothetical protein